MDDREIRKLLRTYDARFDGIERQFGKIPGARDQQKSPEPCLVKIFDTYDETGGSGGKYVGLILAYGRSTAKIAGNLAMPEGMTVPSTDEKCLALDMSHTGGSGHRLDISGGRIYWVIGLHVGRTEKQGSTPDGVAIVVFQSGGAISPPTEPYQLYTPVDDSLLPVWTFGRFMA
jgi:hypothetical protein